MHPGDPVSLRQHQRVVVRGHVHGHPQENAHDDPDGCPARAKELLDAGVRAEVPGGPAEKALTLGPRVTFLAILHRGK